MAGILIVNITERPWHLPKKIEIEKLRRISPSSIRLLKICPLQGILTANRVPNFLPVSPNAIIGSILHKIIESRHKGVVKSWEDYSAIWDFFVDEAEKKMMMAWLEKRFVPLSISAKMYEVKKRKCWNFLSPSLLNEISDNQFDSMQLPFSETKKTNEIFLESKCGGICGIIDTLDDTKKGIKLIDLKTGEIIDEVGNIKQEYREQLKIYASLYHENYGSWPITLEILDLSGYYHIIPYSPDDCEALFKEAKDLMGKANSAIQEKGMVLLSSSAGIASPKPETCYYCTYRPICDSYWEARQKHPDPKWPFDVRGEILSMKKLGDGSILCKIQDSSSQGRISTIRGLFESKHPGLLEKSKKFTMLSLYKENDEGFFKDGPFTTLYIH